MSIPLYGWAAWRTLILYHDRGGALPLSISVGLILLAEAMLAVAVSRNWQLSWWEWHLLMLAAFAAIAIGVRREYASSGSLTGAFGGLYLQGTLAPDRPLARPGDRPRGGRPGPRRRRQTRSSTGCAARAPARTRSGSITHAAGEIRRLDAAFRPYLPSIIADRAADEPAVSRLGGPEQEVSVLFADLLRVHDVLRAPRARPR